jgi:hypothetical protein
MSPERWKKLEEIYNAALLLPKRERQAFLQKACDSDKELLRDVESLLAADDVADDFLQSGAFEIGMKVLS